MEKIFIYRQLGIMLNCGIPIVKALRAASSVCVSQRKKKIWKVICGRVSCGTNISQACSEFSDEFSLLEIGLIKAGESSCSLADMFSHLSELYEFDLKLKRRFAASLQYPLFLAAVMLGFMIITVNFVLPSFISIFESSAQSLPILTRILIFFVNLIKSSVFWKLMLFTGAVLFFACRVYLFTPQGIWNIQKQIRRLPVIGSLTQSLIMARFCRILAVLLNSGMPVNSSLRTAGMALADYPLSQALEEASFQISEGCDLAEAMASSGYFSEKFISAVKVADESSSIISMLIRLSKIYDEQSCCGADRIYACMEPLVLAVLGIFTAFILLGMFIPLYGFINSI